MKTIGDIASEIVTVGDKWEHTDVNRDKTAIVDESTIDMLLTNTREWFSAGRIVLPSTNYIMRAVASEPKELKSRAVKELVPALKSGNIPDFYPPELRESEASNIKLKVKQDSEAGLSMWYTAESGMTFSLKSDYVIIDGYPEIHFVTEGNEKIMASYALAMMNESGEEGDIYVNGTKYSPRNGLTIETVSDVVATVSATGLAPESIIRKG